MVAVRTPTDLPEYVELLAQRVRQLEQRSTSTTATAMPTDPTFNTVTVGSTGPTLDAISNPASGVTVTSGIFLDVVFIDIGWTPPTSPPANEYQIEVALKVSGNYQAPQQYRTSGTNLRVSDLLPNATYGVRVYAINKLGISSVVAGDATNSPTSYKDIATAIDTTTPSMVPWSPGALGAGLRSLIATWQDSLDFDHDVYELQIATNAAFTTGVRSGFFRGSVGSFVDLAVNTTYYVRVRAYDLSGNVGPWSSPSPNSITTKTLQSGDIPASYIENAMILNGTILTAKIGDAQITDAKIDSLAVTKVTAGTIASKDFILAAGGQIKTANINPGFIINSQGISFYNASQVRTIFLDAATGAGTFYGTILSGTSIQAPSIVGGTIETSSTNPKVHLGGGNLVVYDSAGVVQFRAGTTQTYVTIPGGSEGSLGYGFMLSGTSEILQFFKGGATNSAMHLILGATPSIGFGSITEANALHLDDATGELRWRSFENGGIRVMGTTPNSSDFSGQWGGSSGQGGGLRGRTGHTVSVSWDGTNLAFYVDSGGAQVVLGGGTITNPNTKVGPTYASNGQKTFVIAHPTDPARYLVHAAIEGPTADVYYRGTARLKDGVAVVRLPDYFAALTIRGTETVEVTPVYVRWPGPTIVEATRPDAHGMFEVHCQVGNPDAEFFWEVKAERHDARFDSEPLRSDVRVHGSGPYRYLTAA